MFILPAAGVNVPSPLKPPEDADDAGAAKVEPNPVFGFWPNKPPAKKQPIVDFYVFSLKMVLLKRLNSVIKYILFEYKIIDFEKMHTGSCIRRRSKATESSAWRR